MFCRVVLDKEYFSEWSLANHLQNVEVRESWFNLILFHKFHTGWGLHWFSNTFVNLLGVLVHWAFHSFNTLELFLPLCRLALVVIFGQTLFLSRWDHLDIGHLLSSLLHWCCRLARRASSLNAILRQNAIVRGWVLWSIFLHVLLGSREIL